MRVDCVPQAVDELGVLHIRTVAIGLGYLLAHRPFSSWEFAIS